MPNAVSPSDSLRDQLKKHIRILTSKFDARSIPIAFAVVTVISGTIGWCAEIHDVTFQSLALVLFETLGEFTPGAKNLSGGNTLTKTAAICGLLAVYSSALLIAANFLRESRRKLFARLFYRNHSVVIGATPLAQRVNSIWSKRNQRFLQIVSPDGSKLPDWHDRIVRHRFDASLNTAISLHRAKHVVIDLGDDIQTFSLAFQLLSDLPQRAQAQTSALDAEWVIVAQDVNLADHFALKLATLPLQKDERRIKPAIHYVDPDQLIARHFMAIHPLFILAEKQGQTQVHVLIVDFGSIGKHVLEGTFLTSLTIGFKRPCVTIITANAEAFKKKFFSTRPWVEEELDIAFFEPDILYNLQRTDTDAAKLFMSRDETAPFTLIVLTSEKAKDNIEIAFLIESIGKKLGRLNCPLFVLARQADESAFLTSHGKFSEAIGGFTLFGLSDEVLELQLCDSVKRDAFAKALHSQYAAHFPSPAKTPAWNDLPESFRRANRNAADHWQAKMYAFGYDIGNMKTGVLPKLQDTEAQALIERADTSDLSHIDKQFMDVVRIEHERWMMERGLDGWIFGRERDDVRRLHPFLIPWETLRCDFPNEVLKDIEQIKSLIVQMQQAGDPAIILEKRSDGAPAPFMENGSVKLESQRTTRVES